MNYKKVIIVSLITFLLILLITKPLTSSSKKVDIDDVNNKIKEATKPKHILDEIGIHGEFFMDKMGRLESSNNYTIVNRLGYLGKYQFHKKTLERIGFTQKDIKNFLKTPELQEKAMIELTKYNNDYIIRNDLDIYINKTINGVKVTKEGMLAAAHLRGPYAVKRYLYTGGKINMKDANKTSVKDYMKEFELIP